MTADLLRLLAATIAPFLLAVEVWLLLAALFPAAVPPTPAGPDVVAEAERRRALAAVVAAHFPPPAAIGRVPYVASGRAGRVEREQDTVALVPAGWSR